jgi:Tfp pilus assembly protein PilO
MKKYFEQLQPMERRLVVAVAVVLVLVLNFMFIWPHFKDWGDLRRRGADAEAKLKLYRAATAQIPTLKADVEKFASAGQMVAPEDQAIDLMRTIQAQAAACGFGIQNFSPPSVHTNDAFFIEHVQNIVVTATEAQLVDFLYKLGSSTSMIRVRDLALQPDVPRQHLNANIKLVASYQKTAAAKNTAAPPKAALPSNNTAPPAKAANTSTVKAK